jgi:SAM-dependent methyltransferase
MLHALLRGFGDTAAYERGRPRLGPAPVALLREILRGPRVLDLGSGTGLVARALLGAGLDVVAVEPLPEMRAVLEPAIGAERVLEGRAEAIPLPDASVDGAVASDAFHWFDGRGAARELHRVVRPGGAVVVCITVAAQDERRPSWSAEVGDVLDELRSAADHPHAAGPRRPDALAEHGGFTALEHRLVPFAHATDREGLLAYVASMSFVGILPAPERADVLRRVAAVLHRHGVGAVELPFDAELWITRRRPDRERAGGRPAGGS